jgi:hypothetical protein
VFGTLSLITTSFISSVLLVLIYIKILNLLLDFLKEDNSAVNSVHADLISSIFADWQNIVELLRDNLVRFSKISKALDSLKVLSLTQHF